MSDQLFVRQANALVVDSFINGPTNFRVDGGLGDGDSHEITALPHRVEVPENDLLNLPLERIPLGQSSCEVLDHVRGSALQDGEEKATFTVKVAMNKALGAVGALRQFARRSAVIAALREYRRRRVDQGLAALLLIAFAALNCGALGDSHGPSPAHL